MAAGAATAMLSPGKKRRLQKNDSVESHHISMPTPDKTLFKWDLVCSKCGQVTSEKFDTLQECVCGKNSFDIVNLKPRAL